MNNLKKKMKKQSGFTLIEMLIVVAIIAILVAISIPLVGSALEGARDATDQANERAAKAEAAIKYTGVETGADYGATTGTFWYDADNGTLIANTESKPAAYGQCKGSDSYSTAAHTNQIIQVVINANGTIDISWVSAS